jgi:ATP-binding cassette subfamily B multidrug efflux pump
MNSAYWEEEKDRSIPAGKALRRLLPLLNPHKKRLLLNLVLLVVATTASILAPITVQSALDLHIVPMKDSSGLVVLALAYVLLQVIYLTGTYFQRVHLETIGQDIITALKRRCFDHITGLNVNFFDNNPVGRLMSRVESDGESLRQMFASIVVMVIGDLLLVAGMLGVMFYKNWRLTLLVLTVAPVVLVLIYWFQRFTTPRFLKVRQRVADITATITEFLQGMGVIQVFNRQETARRRLNEVNRSKFKVERSAEWGVVSFFNVIFFLQNVAIALVLWFAADLTAGEAVSIGVIYMFVLYVRRFFEPVARFSEEIHVIQRAVAGARRIFGLLDTQEIIAEPRSAKSWRGFEKKIGFENVWFSYKGDDTYAVKKLDFEVRKGEKVALVGVTGGGKSTIVNLLLRFYDPTRGRVTVDGIDIRELNTVDLRAKFGLVLQDIFLFPGDVKENIALGDERVSEEQMTRVSKLVSADRFIDRMPEGYKTEISERGANLSRGERQLLSFARAMIQNPQVLLLDEATSSVDPDTEKRITMALRRLLTGRTSVIIAHRLSTILDADRILVIRDGEIVERGSHQELLAARGYYEQLFRLQFKELEEVKVT